MKGNSGFIGKNEDSFFQMMYVGALRGFDSTGAIAVEHDGTFHIAKEAVEATFFAPQLKTHKIGRDMYARGKAFIGHNRKKTVGKILDETAHPFVVDNTFAMVHNGTLFQHQQLANTDTDSEALAIVLKQAFDKDDLIPAIEETLGKVFGAYALAMYNQKKDCVYLLRNKERPLVIVEADDAYYFASEPGMLSWILTRNGYDHAKLKFRAVPEHTLVTFDLMKAGLITEQVLVPKKATSPTYHGTTTYPPRSGSTNGGSIGAGSSLPKSGFKLFKRKYLGKKLSFWVDDFIEKNYPKTLEQGETDVILFARDEDIKEFHTITADADLSQSGMKTQADILEQRWIGTVESISHNEEMGSCTLNIIDCKPVLTSSKAFKDGLKDKSLQFLTKGLENYKDHMVTWQVKAYEEAIEERKAQLEKVLKNYHALGVDAVIEEYRDKGIVLEQEIRQGKNVYINPLNKEVVYESPVALH